jgi:ArsR family transcriptional regulator
MKEDHKEMTLTQELSAFPAPCCTLDIAGAEQERLVAMFKALGNPHRFEIIKYLVTHPGCITGDIVEFLPIAQATVSQHLKVLRDAGWITGVVEGPATSYCLNEGNIAWFRDKVGEIF